MNRKWLIPLLAAAAVVIWLWLRWRIDEGNTVRTALKKLAVLVAVLACGVLAWLGHEGVFNGTVEGTEQVFYGTVTDRAMDKIDWNDRFSPSRPYIGVSLADGGGTVVWRRAYDRTDVQVGDYVRIDAAEEENTGLLLAVEITVLEKKS